MSGYDDNTPSIIFQKGIILGTPKYDSIIVSIVVTDIPNKLSKIKVFAGY